MTTTEVEELELERCLSATREAIARNQKTYDLALARAKNDGARCFSQGTFDGLLAIANEATATSILLGQELVRLKRRVDDLEKASK